ncbi:MAG: EamA family transporter [Candidatus Parcubacteria bacterium]|nr:EamA family transporter [Candidatus Parcubacteria bacterium]
MFWLYISIFAYLLFALANIGDKLVVSKFKTEPIAYAFYVGVFGLAALILIPFSVKIISLNLIALSFLAGLAFILAAFFMYKSLEQGEASRAITILGSSSPIFTFLLAASILGERLRANELLAFGLLVMAILLLSWHKEEGRHSKFHLELVIWALLAGLFFSFNYVLTKYLFYKEDFITVFFWTRMGGVLTALIIFLLPTSRKMILKDWHKPKKQKGMLVLAIQITGGLGVLSQSYALKLASATLVNALQAIQYALVFVLALILGKKITVLREKIDKHHLTSKIAAIILVAIGLYFITLK